MGLQKYKEKRHFDKTPEPDSEKGSAAGGLKFVIQRHDASRLHYDFRLEMEGVLKSWAVPKGPSLYPKDKRLAMMVEDHPFSYRTFEGVIPEGNYGAGVVEIWDEGTYHAMETANRKESEKILLDQLEGGNLKFILHGKKLNGEFALVKIKNSDGPKDNAWLLIKHKDEHAWDEAYNSEDHVSPSSKIKKKAKSTKKADLKSNGAAKANHVEGKDPMPTQVVPMMAKIKDEPFDDENFIFEIKLDGYRAIAEVDNEDVRLYSRNLLPFDKKYPAIVQSLAKLGHRAVLDGEIVVMDPQGVTSFQLLQQYEDAPSPGLMYFVFDILYLDGYDIRNLPLLERKKFLKEILPDLDNVRYNDHIQTSGIEFFKLAGKNKLEGIMAKKADGPYRTGSRSTEWLKIKHTKRQEAVICGFTAPRGGRKNFGALILGVYDKDKLTYVGHTGSGFSTQGLSEMMNILQPIIRPTSPFASKIKTNEKVTWVEPRLVCEIAFAEWTKDGHMRQPIYQGLREDKSADEVVKEVESALPDNIAPSVNAAPGLKTKRLTTTKGLSNMDETIDGHKLKLTHLDKIYWPGEGYTKGDLINYYRKISKWILPYLKDRPESLNRHPNGILGDNFFQKDMGDALPDWIEATDVHSESNNKNIHYLICQNEATLVYMNNLGCIEINPWSSRVGAMENPDYCIIDLDPGENTFEEVIETALVVKEILDKAGAEAYCKTSGSTGMHIYIPLGALYDYEESKNFAHVIAQLAHSQLPELTSLERSPKDRRKQIYLDYLQNRTGQTLAAAYSVRPKPGATVSTPLDWKEVRPGLHPSQFNIKNIFKRLEKKGDLFTPVLGKGIDMHRCIQNLGG